MEGGFGGCWEGKDKILVKTHGFGPKSTVFILDLKENKANEVGGRLINQGGMCSLTELDGVIYAFGKLHANAYEENPMVEEKEYVHSAASVLDLSKGECECECEWKPLEGGNEMVYKDRCCPISATLGGKVFVFGGYHDHRDPRDIHGEYFDQRSNKWFPIPSPEGAGGLACAIPDPENDRLFCYFCEDGSLYAYYPSRPLKPWACLEQCSDSFVWYPQNCSSVVGNVIYFYCDRDAIIAYDIAALREINVIWSSDSLTPAFTRADLLRCPYYGFVSLGCNILCYISTQYVHPPATDVVDDPYMYPFQIELYLFRFRVCRDSPEQVTVTPLSLHTILLPCFRYPENFVPL